MSHGITIRSDSFDEPKDTIQDYKQAAADPLKLPHKFQLPFGPLIRQLNGTISLEERSYG